MHTMFIEKKLKIAIRGMENFRTPTMTGGNLLTCYITHKARLKAHRSIFIENTGKVLELTMRNNRKN